EVRLSALVILSHFVFGPTSRVPRPGAMSSAPERVELLPFLLQRLEGGQPRAQTLQNLLESPDLIIVSIEADIDCRPSFHMLHRAGRRIVLIEGVDVTVEMDVRCGDRAVVLPIPRQHRVMV